MPSSTPWADYNKARLRSGLSYPIGRDQLERALREAGATIGSLAFVMPAQGHPTSADDQLVMDLFWRGGTQPGLAYLRVWAVLSPGRHEIAAHLAETLPAVCRWIADGSARDADSVWSTTNHGLTVRYRDGAIHVDEHG